MACIVCLATVAAIAFGVGVSVDEWLDKKLARLAEAGSVIHDTESVATWQGEFKVCLDDGTEKIVPVTIRLFKDVGRVRVQIDDHSLTEEEAARLEDEILEALDADLVERRYPSDGAQGEKVEPHDHAHDEDVEQEEAPAEELEVPEPPAPNPRPRRG